MKKYIYTYIFLHGLLLAVPYIPGTIDIYIYILVEIQILIIGYTDRDMCVYTYSIYIYL